MSPTDIVTATVVLEHQKFPALRMNYLTNPEWLTVPDVTINLQMADDTLVLLLQELSIDHAKTMDELPLIDIIAEQADTQVITFNQVRITDWKRPNIITATSREIIAIPAGEVLGEFITFETRMKMAENERQLKILEEQPDLARFRFLDLED